MSESLTSQSVPLESLKFLDQRIPLPAPLQHNPIFSSEVFKEELLDYVLREILITEEVMRLYDRAVARVGATVRESMGLPLQGPSKTRRGGRRIPEASIATPPTAASEKSSATAVKTTSRNESENAPARRSDAVPTATGESKPSLNAAAGKVSAQPALPAKGATGNELVHPTSEPGNGVSPGQGKPGSA